LGYFCGLNSIQKKELMAQVEILLPKMGESVAEATIIKWLKEEGETIEADESIIEIATDKVDSEVPSPSEGVLVKRLCNEGDVIEVGAVLGIISTEGEETAVVATNGSAAKSAPETVEEKTVAAPVAVEEELMEPLVAASVNGNGALGKTGPSGKFYSPLVRNIASKEGVTMAELESILGSGSNGRVTKKDILNYLPSRDGGSVQTQPQVATKPATTTPAPAVQKTVQQPPVTVGSGDEIIEMDRMRKLIADHMVMSKQVSPHVTSYVEADVTSLVMWRNKIKNQFQEREGEKITFTPIFIEAVVKAIKDFPMINVSVDGDKIIKKGNINIGMAAALPSGNLIVPVIKNADQFNLLGLTKQVNDMANRARNNALKPDEIQGGTYTVTNVGTFGNVMGTPIINQPQVAILALGAIRKIPAVIETPYGDTIGIRHKMFLSHAYDHRVVDGALGGSFVRRVADYLEQFDVNREI
jgi:2-oxoglutarate dehydrogenase E2 component (dihydrolipoamide succinyltransferase)